MTLLLLYFAFEIAAGAILSTVIAFGLNHHDYLLGPTQRAEQARKDRQLGARIFLASLFGLLPLVGLVALVRVADVPSLLTRASPPESGDLSFPESK